VTIIDLFTTLLITTKLLNPADSEVPPTPSTQAKELADQVAPNAKIWRQEADVYKALYISEVNENERLQAEIKRLSADYANLQATYNELKAENERLKALIPPKQAKPAPAEQSKPVATEEIKAQTIEVEATFYTADCQGCSGITATGIDVRNSITSGGHRIIAVDPSVIALGSVVRVALSNGESFTAIAADTGGAIKGARIDVLVGDSQTAISYGRQTATVEILN